MVPSRGVGVRLNRKPSYGVASSDLPPVSSDLDQGRGKDISYQYHESSYQLPRQARQMEDANDGDSEEMSIRPIGGPLATENRPTSRPSTSPSANRMAPPVSPKQAIARVPVASSPSKTKKETEADMAPVSSSRPQGPSEPARKRAVNKAMIGKPTNFQHTGHIGAGAYSAATALGNDPEAARALKLRLSEVAAALDFGDAPITKTVDADTTEKHLTNDQRIKPNAQQDEPCALDGSVPEQNGKVEQGQEQEYEHAAKMRTRSDATLIDDLALNASSGGDPTPASSPVKKNTASATRRVAVPKIMDEEPVAEILVTEEPRRIQEPSSSSTLAALDRTPSSASGVGRSSSTRRKPVSVPNKLAALYDEFKQEEPFKLPQPPLMQPTEESKKPQLQQQIPQPRAKAMGLSPLMEDDEEMRKLTYRLNGKRMVPGPGGDYITDTAHGRWDKALMEITQALKRQVLEQGGADDDVELAEGLRQADEVLSRLNSGIQSQ